MACAALVAACAPSPGQGGYSFILGADGGPVFPVDTAGSPVVPAESGGATASPVAVGTAMPTSGGGAAAPGARPPSYLLLADGRVVAVPASGAVTLPAGTSGTVTLVVAGRVPSTIELGGGPLPTLHPREELYPGDPMATADVSGALTVAQADVAVSYVSPGRRVFVGDTTTATGTYAFSLPVGEPETGLLVAREGNDFPALALVPMTLNPNQSIAAPALSLVAPSGLHPAAPPAPPGLDLTGGALRVAVGTSSPTWMTVLAVPGGNALPAYTMPGVDFSIAYEASSPDGRQGATVSGAPGVLPAFLSPPDLSAAPVRIEPGTTLRWPSVPGASLYTVRIADASTQEMPLWEAAATTPRVTVPSGLSFAGRGLVLQVTAWDAPELTTYSVAGLRQLRVPNELPGPAGRASRTIRTLVP